MPLTNRKIIPNSTVCAPLPTGLPCGVRTTAVSSPHVELRLLAEDRVEEVTCDAMLQRECAAPHMFASKLEEVLESTQWKVSSRVLTALYFVRPLFGIGLQWWLQDWLCPREAESSNDAGRGGSNGEVDNGAKDDGMEDIYAVGLQEVVDLNAVNVAIDSKSQVRRTLDQCCR